LEYIYTSIFASSDAAGLKGVTTANSKRGGINYNLNMNKRMVRFRAGDLETDQFQELDLRFVPSAARATTPSSTKTPSSIYSEGSRPIANFFSTGLQRDFRRDPAMRRTGSQAVRQLVL